MVSECDRFIKTAIPAIRIAVAELLSTKYRMSQKNIANGLGITQAAVNKYLNGKHSEKIGKLIIQVKKEGTGTAIAGMVASGKDPNRVNERIDSAASSMYQNMIN
jgi:predicted transcriptional regulator